MKNTIATRQIIHNGEHITDLPEEWLSEANMLGFVPKTAAYRVDEPPKVKKIRIDTILPVKRAPSVSIFNDDKDTGLSAHERVISILRAFACDTALPPVKVAKDKSGNMYKLMDGTHRLYCSLAVGFTRLPVVVVSDWSRPDDATVPTSSA